MYIHVCIYIYTHMYTHIHIYIYIYIHIYRSTYLTSRSRQGRSRHDGYPASPVYGFKAQANRYEDTTLASCITIADSVS